MKYIILWSLWVLFFSGTCFANAADGNTNKQLFEAIKNGNLSEVRVALVTGADVNTREDEWTLLHKAAFWHRTEIAKLLIKSGADVDAKDKNGWTPLHWAARNGYIEIVKLLLTANADVNAVGNKRWAPQFGWAARWTPLYTAAHDNHIDIVKLLLINRADVNMPNEDGTTPLGIARTKKYQAVIDAIVKFTEDQKPIKAMHDKFKV